VEVEAVVRVDRDPSHHHDDRPLDDLDLDQVAGAMMDMDLSPRMVTDMNANMILNVHQVSPVMDMASAKDQVRDHTVEAEVEVDDQDLPRDDLDPNRHPDDLVQEAEAMMDTVVLPY